MHKGHCHLGCPLNSNITCSLLGAGQGSTTVGVLRGLSSRASDDQVGQGSLSGLDGDERSTLQRRIHELEREYSKLRVEARAQAAVADDRSNLLQRVRDLEAQCDRLR